MDHLFFFLLAVVLPIAATGDTVNPFTAKAATIRYWNRRIPNNRPHPSFLLSKLSPLTAVAATAIAADPSSLCSSSTSAAAGVLCHPSIAASTTSSRGGAFSNYGDVSNFSNYGNADDVGFTTYSGPGGNPVETFRRYEHNAAGRNDKFANYQPGANFINENFTSYAGGAAGGAGEFSSYNAGGNDINTLAFSNYDASANGRSRQFKDYSGQANTGDNSFSGYGRHGNGLGETFTLYSNGSNNVFSNFTSYGDSGNGVTDEFKAYANGGNDQDNTFRSYGAGGNAGTDKFTQYRLDANIGDDYFTSYAKDENGGVAAFESYGTSINQGSSNFASYGEGINENHEVSFKAYIHDATTFKAYSKSGITFSEYNNRSVGAAAGLAMAPSADERRVGNQWIVEPGKFFREKELTTGNVMPMPDIRDKMPPRTFLPRSVTSKIPFKAEAVNEMFNVEPGTAMWNAVASTMADCTRTPSRGETKRCVASAEDLIDFAVSVLGSNIVVRSTENVNGSGGSILIGDVKAVNERAVTESVSCHQSFFPYLVYYCHSVPKVRVYEADILAVDTKATINHGVAICHLDTSAWGATHGAFVALGGKPGEHEVCHWIFEGDLTWTVAN